MTPFEKGDLIMGCKSGIYVVNVTQGTAIANGGILPLGNIIRRYGQNINLGGNGVTLSGGGYYDVDATATVTATAAGPVSAALYLNGVAIPGAVATVTAAADEIVTLPISALARLNGCNAEGTLTLVIGGQAVTTYNTALVVEKI